MSCFFLEICRDHMNFLYILLFNVLLSAQWVFCMDKIAQKNTLEVPLLSTGSYAMWYRDKSYLHASPVHDVACQPNGSLIATACENGVRLWDSQDGTVKVCLKEGEPVRSVLFNQQGTLLATIGHAELTVWDTAGSQVLALPWIKKQIAHCAFAKGNGIDDSIAYSEVGGTQVHQQSIKRSWSSVYSHFEGNKVLTLPLVLTAINW